MINRLRSFFFCSFSFISLSLFLFLLFYFLFIENFATPSDHRKKISPHFLLIASDNTTSVSAIPVSFASHFLYLFFPFLLLFLSLYLSLPPLLYQSILSSFSNLFFLLLFLLIKRYFYYTRVKRLIYFISSNYYHHREA